MWMGIAEKVFKVRGQRSRSRRDQMHFLADRAGRADGASGGLVIKPLSSIARVRILVPPKLFGSDGIICKYLPFINLSYV